jgi:hypothetical protein
MYYTLGVPQDAYSEFLTLSLNPMLCIILAQWSTPCFLGRHAGRFRCLMSL